MTINLFKLGRVVSDSSKFNKENLKSTNLMTRKREPVKQDSFLYDSIVYTPSGEPFQLRELWRDKTVVLKVLPRLGCKFCKYDAQSLSDLSLLVDPNKVTIAAVAYTDPDLATFLADGYWSWSIYLDPYREVYKKARLYRVSRWQMMKDLIERRIWAMSNFIDSKFTLSNTLRGDPYQLGGTFVIAPGGHVKYQFRPTKLAMYPSLKEIFQVLGGDPNDIIEPSPSTNVYSQREANMLYCHKTSKSTVSTKSFKSHHSSPNLLAGI